MKRTNIIFITTFIVVSCLLGCKGDTGPAGAPLSGSITGFVILVQSDGSRPLDLSGTLVTIEGTSFSTITDSTGKWTINNLSEGTYTIFYSKQGYSMARNNNVEFVGGGTYYLGKAILAQPPNFTVTIDPVKTITDSNSVYVVANVNSIQTTGYSYVLIVIGTGSDVSAADPNKYLYTVTVGINSSSASPIRTHIYRSDLAFAGLTGGIGAYVVVYPLYYSNSSIVGYSSYIDHATGRTVYTSLGTPSAVIPVTIP